MSAGESAEEVARSDDRRRTQSEEHGHDRKTLQFGVVTASSPENERVVFGFRVYGVEEPRRRRGIQLAFGLVLFAVAMSLMVEARLGVSPWTSFHQGTADAFNVSFGTTVVVVGALLLALFRPLKEPLGFGTLANVFLVGPMIDLVLWSIPEWETLWWRVPALLISPILLGLATGLYIGAGLGTGPRDGMMTAIARRGVKVSYARWSLEIAALTIGWILGGDIGLGTVWFAFMIGWCVRVFLPRFTIGQLTDSASTGDST